MADEQRQRVLLIGGSGGIGTVLARRLHQKGAKLVLAARGEDRLQELAGELDCDYLCVDATDLDQVTKCVNDANERLGGLNGLAHCVGSFMLKPAHLTSDEEWSTTIALNLTSAFGAVRAASKVMMNNKGGSIVLMSSAAARTGLHSHEAIAAAKAGVIGLTQSAAASYASRGIRVNCLAPGLVQTPLTSKVTSNESSLKASISMHPLGRVGNPEDVANAIDWLLDPSNSWLTGQVIGIDGGLATLRPR